VVKQLNTGRPESACKTGRHITDLFIKSPTPYVFAQRKMLTLRHVPLHFVRVEKTHKSRYIDAGHCKC